MYLVTDGSHVDVVCKTLKDVAFEMAQRYDYFRYGMPDCWYTPENQKIDKGFTFYAFEETENGEIELFNQYFCTYEKIDSLAGLSMEVLRMSDCYLN